MKRVTITLHPGCCLIPTAIVLWACLVGLYTLVTNLLGV